MARPPSDNTRLADVAAYTGVSRSVVGHVLHGTGGRNTRVSSTTAERVLKAAAELNYRPNRAAQQLSGVGSRLLGALIAARGAQVHADRLVAIERGLRKHHYRLLIGHIDDDPAALVDYLDDFQSRCVEAVILVDQLPGEQLPQVRRRLRNVPCMLCAGRPAIGKACSVDVDRADGVRAIVAHLIERGRRHIGLALDFPASPEERRRLRGFIEGLHNHGIEMAPQQVWSANLSEAVFDDNVIRDMVESMINSWVLPQRFDAIVAADDLWAVQVIKALQRRNIRVPEDVAVTGFDNIDVARACSPELTTIDQENERVADRAVPLLLELIEHGSLPRTRRQIVIEPRLIVRNST